MADRARRQHEAAARGAGRKTPTVRRKAAAKGKKTATGRKPAVAERVGKKEVEGLQFKVSSFGTAEKGKVVRKKATRAGKRGSRNQSRLKIGAPSQEGKVWTAEKMLPNPAQERFCQLYADGRFSGRSCYAQAFGSENDGTCRTMACSLLTNVDIQQRIAWLREESLKNWKCEKEEVMRFLHAVVMTPVGYVDEESPLAQEVTRDIIEKGEEEPDVLKVKVKMPGKKECAELLAKMQGWEKPAEVKLNVSYEPPAQALKRAADKGVDLVSILKKAGIRL
jgi:hypothetical protein